MKRVLLSCYACQPNRGSEHEVGWQWAINLAAKNKFLVYVITRTDNKKYIDQSPEILKNNINFLYVENNIYLKLFTKKGIFLHLYYFFWQLSAFNFIKNKYGKNYFDIIHHVTFVNFRKVTFLYKLTNNFIYGPVSGGENIPIKLYKCLNFIEIIQECFRSLLNYLVKFKVIQSKVLKNSKSIYVTTSSSKIFIPKCYFNKTKVLLAISNTSERDKKNKIYYNDNILRVLFIGTLNNKKGLKILISTIDKIFIHNKNFKFTIIGTGILEKKFKNFIIQKKLQSFITHIPKVNHESIEDYYFKNEILFFPSLRESGGMVPLEAISCGLPVICFNNSSLDEIIDNSSGQIIDVKDKNIHIIINECQKSLIKFSKNKNYIYDLSQGAFRRSKNFNWIEKINIVYENSTNS